MGCWFGRHIWVCRQVKKINYAKQCHPGSYSKEAVRRWQKFVDSEPDYVYENEYYCGKCGETQ